MTSRTFTLLLACSWPLVVACESTVRSHERCPGHDTISQALYGADAEPTAVTLDPEQRLAIVALYGPQGPERGVCTGTLIAARWVLTAAHCQALPVTELSFGDDALDAQLRSGLRNVAVHESLDLMLVELAQPEAVAALGAQPFLRAVTPDAEAWSDVRAQLAGFGRTEGGDPGRLLFADEAIVDADERSVQVDGAQVSGACLGDSGGPLLVESEAGEPVLIGALSVGAATCDGIDTYTRLDAASDWIALTIGRDEPLQLGPGCADR